MPYFQHESATVRLRYTADARALVIGLYSKDRNKGHATELMNKVVQYADDRSVTLALIAQQFGQPIGPDNAYLEKFYARFGFVREFPFSCIYMVRKPSREIQVS
jgi:GNAT superfamily N-acetyltransferase